MRIVSVRVFSWVSGDTRKGFLSRSLGMSITLAYHSESTMTRRDRVRKVILPTCLFLDAFLKLESVFRE